MIKKLNIKRTVPILLAIIVIIASSIYFVTRTSNSIYKKYSEDDKTVGSIQNIEKDSDNFYVSLFYPAFDIKKLDTKVKEIFEADIKAEKASDDKNTLYMDYSTSENFGQYITTNLKFQRFDQEDKEVSKKVEVITYDKNLDRILTVKDVFRGKYRPLLEEKGIAGVSDDATSVGLDKSNIYIYHENKKVTIPFKENEEYMALNNSQIAPKAPIDVKSPAIQPKVDPAKPMVAITFDDGPHASNTQRVMSIFDKYDGRATFFMLGKLVKAYPNVVKDVYERGFEVANHSWSHANLPKQDLATINKEIYDTQDAIFAATGQDPKWFRPPYGAYNPTIKSESLAGSVNIMLWTVDTIDWKLRNAEAIKNKVLADAYDGAVILLHDIHGASVDGIELALPILKEQGYQFVTLDTLKQYRDIKNW